MENTKDIAAKLDEFESALSQIEQLVEMLGMRIRIYRQGLEQQSEYTPKLKAF